MELLAFELAGQQWYAPLDTLREVVRLRGLRVLPGARPPLVGVVDVRGESVPVLDARGDGPSGLDGDVLVLLPGTEAGTEAGTEPAAVPGGADALGVMGAVGVACDRVTGVVSADGPLESTAGLPGYVQGLHRAVGPEGAAVLTPVVDVRGLVAAVAGMTVPAPRRLPPG